MVKNESAYAQSARAFVYTKLVIKSCKHHSRHICRGHPCDRVRARVCTVCVLLLLMFAGIRRRHH